MVKKYKEIPPEFEAIQYTGDNLNEILGFCNALYTWDEGKTYRLVYMNPTISHKILNVGDFVVRLYNAEDDTDFFKLYTEEEFHRCYKEIENG